MPFVVRSLWRFKLPNGIPVVVAGVTRQLNQEATPLQEYTFLVAEQSASDSSYSTKYSERIYGAVMDTTGTGLWVDRAAAVLPAGGK